MQEPGIVSNIMTLTTLLLLQNIIRLFIFIISRTLKIRRIDHIKYTHCVYAIVQNCSGLCLRRISTSVVVHCYALFTLHCTALHCTALCVLCRQGQGQEYDMMMRFYLCYLLRKCVLNMMTKMRTTGTAAAAAVCFGLSGD